MTTRLNVMNSKEKMNYPKKRAASDVPKHCRYVPMLCKDMLSLKA